MMQGCLDEIHNLSPCQGWITKDGIVWQRDVGDVEVEAFCPLVVPGAEGDG
jgi:hypothetical protein